MNPLLVLGRWESPSTRLGENTYISLSMMNDRMYVDADMLCEAASRVLAALSKH